MLASDGTAELPRLWFGLGRRRKIPISLSTLYVAITQLFVKSVSSVSRGIEGILVNEINQLIALHSSKLNTQKIDKSIVQKLPVDSTSGWLSIGI